MKKGYVLLGFFWWGNVVMGGWGDCLKEAASRYSLNPYVLYAIVVTESALNPYAVEIIAPDVDKNIPCPFKRLRNKVLYSCMPINKRDAFNLIVYAREKKYSYSAGLGQINLWWIKKLELDPEILLDPCYNLHVSAYILNLCWYRFGNSWKTVDCYNKGAGRASETSDYVIRVYRELRQWMTGGK